MCSSAVAYRSQKYHRMWAKKAPEKELFRLSALNIKEQLKRKKKEKKKTFSET
jgi:hypothetical protein